VKTIVFSALDKAFLRPPGLYLLHHQRGDEMTRDEVERIASAM